MAYNNYFPAGYQPAQIYYPQNQVQPQIQSQPQQQPATDMRWVTGEAGAKAYLVAPNQTVQLWDSEAPVIYLKSADQMGIPSMRIIDYTFRDSTPKSKEILDMEAFATKDDVDSLKAEIEALRAKFEVKEGAKK